MNDKLLIRHFVNISQQHIGFLSYIHPNFDLVEDINSYDNPCPIGIIYIGQLVDDLTSKLDRITKNWIVVNNHKYDDDLTTNDGLLKALLPVYYASSMSNIKKGEAPAYKTMDYNSIIEKIKICLIDGSKLKKEDCEDQSVYNLFASILCSYDVLNHVYFNMVTPNNIRFITSSVLSFLNKVQNQQISHLNPHYARLLLQSYRRYGKYIKQAVANFVKSDVRPEIALHKLLTFLNRAK